MVLEHCVGCIARERLKTLKGLDHEGRENWWTATSMLLIWLGRVGSVLYIAHFSSVIKIFKNNSTEGDHTQKGRRRRRRRRRRSKCDGCLPIPANMQDAAMTGS